MAKSKIYWNDSGAAEPAVTPQELPDKIDVAIIGAGFTGLTAAIHLARAGRSVAVFDAGIIGHGCSSRNGGMVGPSFHKLGMAGLTAKFGEAKANAIMMEGMNALDFFEQFVTEENLDCDLQMTGRFRGAWTDADYESMARECERLNKAVGLPFEMVPREKQTAEIGSDFYRGGVVYARDGGIHPRKLVVALANKAAETGALLLSECPVTGIRRGSDGKSELRTPRGILTARDVVVATNAYSDSRTSAMDKRVVQIETGAIATEELPAGLIEKLSPKYRMHGESGRIFMWYRPSPDRKRFIFGGRMGGTGCSPSVRVEATKAAAARVFPEIANVAISHVWHGNVGYTIDHAPHLGFEDGVWLAGGYCGSGVTRSVYFAMKLARKILKENEAETAFDDLTFAPIPFKPFSRFAADIMTRWWSWKDERDLKRRR